MQFSLNLAVLRKETLIKILRSANEKENIEESESGGENVERTAHGLFTQANGDETKWTNLIPKSSTGKEGCLLVPGIYSGYRDFILDEC